MTLELTILAVEIWLGENLKQIIKDQKKYNEIFAKLTSPIDLTFYRQEEKELIEIYNLEKEQQEFALKDHQKKYYWIYNSYLEAKILGLGYFLHNLEKLKKENINQMLNSINNYPNEIKKEKKNIIEKLNLDEATKALIKLSEEFSILQDVRKKYNFMADHYLELFSKEIENRFNININDVKVLLPDEIRQLIEGKLEKNIILERKPIFVIHAIMDKMEFITGKKAEEIKSTYSIIKKTDQSRAIQGVIASRGKSYYFRGVAKILFSPKEIDKINEGDILVTTMTSPDCITAM